MDAIQEFKGAIRAHGLNPPEIIEPGKLHRFPTNGRASDDAGWCKLFPDCVGGVFGDFRSGLSETWQAQREKPFTSAEREAFRQRCEVERRAREAEDSRRHAEAREKAAEIWKASTPASASHPYLARKQVEPVESLREIDSIAAAEILGYVPKYRDKHLAGRLLVVPVVKVAGKLSTLELIDELGRKSALYGGAKAGGYWAVQPLPDTGTETEPRLTILIGEGVATVLSAWEATGLPVIAALILQQPLGGSPRDAQAPPGCEAGHPRRPGQRKGQSRGSSSGDQLRARPARFRPEPAGRPGRLQ